MLPTNSLNRLSRLKMMRVLGVIDGVGDLTDDSVVFIGTRKLTQRYLAETTGMLKKFYKQR